MVGPTILCKTIYRQVLSHILQAELASQDEELSLEQLWPVHDAGLFLWFMPQMSASVTPQHPHKAHLQQWFFLLKSLMTLVKLLSEIQLIA